MSTPHNSAEKGQIAKTVLMPGDPLRAQFIAETFLENPVQFNAVRNMFGYTGTYKGKTISVMGSGMGMPSIGIYSYELFSQYGVENIIRIGSAGAYSPDLKIFDVVLANSAYSESSYARVQSGYEADKTFPSAELNGKLIAAAEKLGIPLTVGCIHSSDVFYREGGNDYIRSLVDDHQCLAVEMESFALFHNARVLGKHAACLITISDSFVTSEVTTAQQRQNSFTRMMQIAQEAAE